MFLISRLIDLARRLGPPRFAHEIQLKRLERWHTLEKEYFLLEYLVDPGRAAIDVGANEGYYTTRLAQLCPRVHCFEPLPWLAKHLREVVRGNVIVHEVAASDQIGTAELRVPLLGNLEMHGGSTIELGNPLAISTGMKSVSCRIDCIDNLITEDVGFMKIDVEGHELATLRGAVGTIRKCRPIVLLESEKRHNAEAPESVFQFMTEQDYRGLFLDRGVLAPLERFDASVNQAVGAIQFLDGRFEVADRYVNNFVFIPV